MPDRRPFTILHRAEFERSGKWLLARRSLEVRSLGMNLVELAAGEDIPEHDEVARDQEEIFIVLDGEPTIVIDGTAHALKPGTFVRLDPEVTRTMRNDGEQPALVLIVSAPRASG